MTGHFHWKDRNTQGAQSEQPNQTGIDDRHADRGEAQGSLAASVGSSSFWRATGPAVGERMDARGDGAWDVGTQQAATRGGSGCSFLRAKRVTGNVSGHVESQGGAEFSD